MRGFDITAASKAAHGTLRACIIGVPSGDVVWLLFIAVVVRTVRTIPREASGKYRYVVSRALPDLMRVSS